MYKHILLDLDGTLTDSRVGITESVRQALLNLGYPAPPRQELEWVVGPPLRASFMTLANTTDAGVTEQLLAEYRKRFEPIGMFENEVYPNIPETLQSLKEKNFTLFLATSKPRVYAEKILDHFSLTEFFTGIGGAELDGSIDSKSDVIRHVLSTYGLRAEACVMVGDREHDVLGAKEHNIPTIGVTYGFGSVEELTNAGAIELSPTPEGIVSICLKMNQDIVS